MPSGLGDEFIHIQAGAGGFGDPLERDTEKVLCDVANELITVGYANDVYGVVIRDGEVDLDGTADRRIELRSSGTNKTAYLSHFYEATGIIQD